MECNATALNERFRFYWNVVTNTVSYYTKFRFIFYSELALIAFCAIDFTTAVTQLIILANISNRNTAFSDIAFSMPSENLLMHSWTFWSDVCKMWLILYLVESLVRIFFILQLAFYHNKKVIDGDLCCMTCHSSLMTAAMTSKVVLSHFLSAFSIIAHFIYSNYYISNKTVALHRQYFAKSPFVNKTRAKHALNESMFYKIGQDVLNDLQLCRYNRNESIEDSAISLLNYGRLESVLDSSCATETMHCIYGRHYLQMSIESVLSVMNYAIIRALFGHIINMHQYEVYNQQTRLQTRGDSRIIRVYRLRLTRAQNKSRLTYMQLPRQALMSLVNLGTNMVSRFRSSRGTQRQMYETPINAADFQTEDNIEEQLAAAYSAMSTATEAFETASRGSSKLIADTDCAAARTVDEQPAAPKQQQQQQQQQQLYNRQSAINTKRVSYEFVKVSDLFPKISDATGDQQQQQQQHQLQPKGVPPSHQHAKKPRAAEWYLNLPGLPSASTNDRQNQQSEQEQTKSLDEPLTENDITSTVEQARAQLTKVIQRRLFNKRVNDSIFTDETFYSLEST